MKLQLFFVLTHGFATATVAACVLLIGQTGTMAVVTATLATCVVVGGAASWLATRRIRTSLAALQSVLTDHENFEALRTGLNEFDQSLRIIGKCARRWETTAANTRQQTRELQSMMLMLDRRGTNSQPTSSQLRDLLAGLGNSLHAHLLQIEQGTSEIDQCTQAITEGTESQGQAVVKTTSCVEQLSTTIAAVSSHAAAASAAVQRTQQSTTAALERVRELIDGMKRVRADTQTSEKKLRGLCDPSRQISAIVKTISDIAERTDLLALNASIESIRAGEHGRGFSIVADEVRKLAEQATDATREITNLIDSMQRVTEESIHTVVREREQVEAEYGRAVATQHALELICNASNHDVDYIHRITEASSQQLLLAQDVVLAVEQISKTAKANRAGAEKICWTMKSLSKGTPQITSEIERMRKCGGNLASQGDSTAHTAAPLESVVFPTALSAFITADTGV